jgi:hypothetical protein
VRLCTSYTRKLVFYVLHQLVPLNCGHEASDPCASGGIVRIRRGAVDVASPAHVRGERRPAVPRNRRSRRRGRATGDAGAVPKSYGDGVGADEERLSRASATSWRRPWR